MKTPEQKALELVRTIARMHRYDFDELRNDEIEDVLETVNGLIFRAREIDVDLDHPVPFPEAEVPVTLTGRQWTALLARIARPTLLSELGQKVYREATVRLQEQLLAASDRHPSTGTGLQELAADVPAR